jgi:hypothetical protein
VTRASAGLSGSSDELRKAAESVQKAASSAVGAAADAVKNIKVGGAAITAYTKLCMLPQSQRGIFVV